MLATRIERGTQVLGEDVVLTPVIPAFTSLM